MAFYFYSDEDDDDDDYSTAGTRMNESRGERMTILGEEEMMKGRVKRKSDDD